jgi:Predicted acetyltransferase
MTVAELEERMRRWLLSGEYRAVLFSLQGELVAYALYKETSEEIYLRHFFVVRRRRRKGIGRTAMGKLFADVWPAGKRLTVSVLVQNTAALSFWRAMGYRDYALTLEIMPGERPGACLKPAHGGATQGGNRTGG